MPASARQATPRWRSNSVTTPCCSTPLWRKPSAPLNWRTLAAWPSRPAAPVLRPGGWKRATSLLLPLLSLGHRSGMPYPDRFYPVVDTVAWLARLAKLNVGTVQQRAKDLDDAKAHAQVRDVLDTVRGTATELVDIEYCRAALDHGAQR